MISDGNTFISEIMRDRVEDIRSDIAQRVSTTLDRIDVAVGNTREAVAEQVGALRDEVDAFRDAIAERVAAARDRIDDAVRDGEGTGFEVAQSLQVQGSFPDSGAASFVFSSVVSTSVAVDATSEVIVNFDVSQDAELQGFLKISGENITATINDQEFEVNGTAIFKIADGDIVLP